MFRSPMFFPVRLSLLLIAAVLVGRVVGCTPQVPASMTTADMQACDDGAAANMGWTDEPAPSNAHPYSVRPGAVEITSPLPGSILPNGKSVDIKFKLPVADPGVLFRNYRILFTSLDGSNLDGIGDQYAVVAQPPSEYQVTWAAPKPGKYIVYVLIRDLNTVPALGNNLAEIGNQLQKTWWQTQDYTIHYGPFSLAYTCIQIENPSVLGAGSQQPGELQPVLDITIQIPTFTKTLTLTPIIPTFTPTLTFTPITPTSTITRTPRPRPTFTPTGTPTNAPQASCSSFSTIRDCEAHNDVCYWYAPATSPPSCKNK